MDHQNENPATETRPLSAADIPQYAEVIRRSFATVARDFGLTKENCPTHPSLISNERLLERYREGYFPFGLFMAGKLAGFVSLTDKGDGVFVMNNVAVLLEYRHYGCGKALLDFCKMEVQKRGGRKIEIDIIEENTVLKEWYAANGFVHMGTKRFAEIPVMVGYMEFTV